MQKITPFLWFDNQAEEAVKFYTSIFKNSEIKSVIRYGDEGAKAAGRPKKIGVRSCNHTFDFKITDGGTLVLKQLSIGWSFFKKRRPANIQHPPSSDHEGLRRTGRG